jgi:RNA polymerase sigma factor (sigma-70 family)
MLNRKTYSKVVTQNSDRIYNYLAKQLKDRTIAEDLTQDCFLQLWKNRFLIKEEVCKSWLYKTAYNKMLNHIRDNQRIDFESEPINNSTTQFTSQIDTQDLLDHIFEQLSTEEKTLILLRDNEGYAYQEIADILELSPSNVKNKLFKARQKFKQKVLNLQEQDKMKCYE